MLSRGSARRRRRIALPSDQLRPAVDGSLLLPEVKDLPSFAEAEGRSSSFDELVPLPSLRSKADFPQ
jgi:hypothetical protein